MPPPCWPCAARKPNPLGCKSHPAQSWAGFFVLPRSAAVSAAACRNRPERRVFVRVWRAYLDAATVAQVFKPAVSPISKSAEHRSSKAQPWSTACGFVPQSGTRLSRLGSLGHIASGLWNPGQCQAAPGAQLSFCAWKMSPLGRTNSGAEHGGGLASIPTRLRNYTWSGCRAVKPATRAKSLVFRVTKIA